MIQSFINWKRRKRFSQHENLGCEARLPFSCLTVDGYGWAKRETFYISRTAWTCKNLAFFKNVSSQHFHMGEISKFDSLNLLA